MSDLGLTLRLSRQEAGLSLAGMARRTGYSRSYLGNVETGVRQVTPRLIKAYERVLGDDVNRRQLLVGGLAALAAAATPTPEVALRVAHQISGERSGLLATAQTTHEVDKAIAALVSSDTSSLASLATWARSGPAVLRVNAAGILAKVRSPVADNAAVQVLKADPRVRELYLAAVVSRVLSKPWDDAFTIATADRSLSELDVQGFADEIQNPADSGARWCSVVLLSRVRHEDPATVNGILLRALRTEPSNENLRAIGSVLAGADPLKI